MKKWMYILLLLTVVLSGCGSQATEQKSDIKGIEDISLKQLSKHKNSYIGDNGAVGAILSGLPGNVIREYEIVDEKELKVTYGVKENADDTEEQFDAYWFDQKDTIEKTYLYNAFAFLSSRRLMVAGNPQDELNNEPAVTVYRQQLEKKLPHSFKEYQDNVALWQKELVDGVVKSKEKRQDVYRVFPMQK
ncbi:DUF4825 domain-containing protein [Bacillus pumilus]|nr:DUF4825 domain-containing protein [Bacillus pumilus]WOP21022.1 DUF4825 domain-containing protein [Bacillus pumilus]